jgi:hypothetical protein
VPFFGFVFPYFILSLSQQHRTKVASVTSSEIAIKNTYLLFLRGGKKKPVIIWERMRGF